MNINEISYYLLFLFEYDNILLYLIIFIFFKSKKKQEVNKYNLCTMLYLIRHKIPFKKN